MKNNIISEFYDFLVLKKIIDSNIYTTFNHLTQEVISKYFEEFKKQKNSSKIVYRCNEFDNKPLNGFIFVNKVNDYKLNNDKKVIVVGEIDVNEKIQSNSFTALSKILERFGNNIPQEYSYVVNPLEKNFVVKERVSKDLSDSALAISNINVLKEKYGKLDVSNEEFLNYLKDSLKNITAEVSKKEEIKEEKNNEKKEDVI